MRPVFVNGLGFWSPGFSGAAAWAAGRAGPAHREPSAAILAAALRRRATSLSLMVAEAASQAAVEAGVSLGELPFVLGSSLGEIACAAEIIASFREDGGLPSPTKFHNSVHSTAVGALSIATVNRLGATAIAAGLETTSAAFVEACLIAGERGGRALLVLADESLPPTFERWGHYPSAAAAFVLSEEPGAACRAKLSNLRRGAGSAPPVPEEWREHPCAGGLSLAAALAKGEAGPRSLDAGGWLVDLEPAVR